MKPSVTRMPITSFVAPKSAITHGSQAAAGFRQGRNVPDPMGITGTTGHARAAQQARTVGERRMQKDLADLHVGLAAAPRGRARRVR